MREFGPDWNYDDSFTNFTAANFNPKEWVDLIHATGAKYFVLTTKHHDCFALFNASNTTDRNSLSTAHTVTFSMSSSPPQKPTSRLCDAVPTSPCRNGSTPDFEPYGYAQLPGNTSTNWPGIIARNPYTGLNEPYTGHIPVVDFIADLMVLQMEILAYQYSTDIMWCNCGAANGTAPFAATWRNHARAQNRQVTINSRCGIAEVADFDTPEYTAFSSVQRREWESNQGMDPYSYGYNRATARDSYMNATIIVHDLVDMVSKNGNFLLDIGPRANGSIVDVEARNLRLAGEWIHAHAEAIFNTTYWFVMSEIADEGVRFTQTDDAFYILFLKKPGPVLYIDALLPLLEGGMVTVIGGKIDVPVLWEKGQAGSPASGFTFYVPEALWETAVLLGSEDSVPG